jgi:hypothetical protein
MYSMTHCPLFGYLRTFRTADCAPDRPVRLSLDGGSAESGRQVDRRDLGGRTGSHRDYVGLSAAVQEELLQPVAGLAGGQERVILALHVRHAEHMAASALTGPALQTSPDRDARQGLSP